MRTSKSLKNSIIAFLANLFVIIIGFIAQKVFISYLGDEYLGINGLFTNIISMLSITELGLSTAIIYSLYEPIAKKQIDKIKGLMYFYKKSYTLVSITILIIGLLLIPFLKYIITSRVVDIEIIIIYILFILDTFFSYFISYKRSIVIANQENYIINIIHIGQLLLLNLLQIIVLIITRNYYLYLVLKIVFRLIENVVIIKYVNKKYPYLKAIDKEHLDDKDKKSIFSNIKALFFHKIGGFIVLGTDNILISKFFGLIKVGMYSNYYMIIHAVNVLFNQIFTSITSSIGNLIVDKNYSKNYEVYKKIKFLNNWLSIFASTAILLIINPFITIWLGEKYLFDDFILIAIIIGFYFQITRTSISIFKEAAGIFYVDRFIPVLEALINIVCSIALAKLFGLAGIFLGAIISNLLLHLYSYPKYVYTKIFKQSYLNYYKEFTKNFIILIFCLLSSYLIAKLYVFDNIYIEIIKNCLISITIPNIILLLLFRKKEEFRYYIYLVKNLTKLKKHI